MSRIKKIYRKSHRMFLECIFGDNLINKNSDMLIMESKTLFLCPAFFFSVQEKISVRQLSGNTSKDVGKTEIQLINPVVSCHP